ncbi:MAG: hypothetical protein LBJ94_02895 [Puniceicoccales bacterium]|jgi:23S rRNA-/tRNA-specific pseudouridylate synthase|nr:hypothetical protein [Puniceicoccales bacterium]
MNSSIYIHHPSYPGKSIELPIIHDDEHCLAVEKPPKIPCRAGQFSIMKQLWMSLQKPSIISLGIQHPCSVYDLEDNLSGILILAKNRESAKVLKNAYGSYMFEFTFDLLCAGSGCDDGREMVCSLPIARHFSKERMLISARTGKKSRTNFNFFARVGKCEHWQARCTYLRKDQLCLHAHESGLAVLGDTLYGRTKIPSFSEIKRHFKANRRGSNGSLYAGIAAHLSTLKLHSGAVIRSELPKKMRVLMKFLTKP